LDYGVVFKLSDMRMLSCGQSQQVRRRPNRKSGIPLAAALIRLVTSMTEDGQATVG
jgi:hypothetical protein